MQSEANDALQAIASMIDRSEKAQLKFVQGTSQHALLQNRIAALTIAAALIEGERSLQGKPCAYAKADLEKALAPIASLISKSEKAQQKLAHGSWQHAMLAQNIAALKRALPLLKEAIQSA